MWLSVLLILLFIAVAIYQSMHGLFSALLMAVLTICCAAFALGYYEWVAGHWLAPHWKPDYALGISLGVLFGGPLLVLRLVIDQIIRRSNLLPAVVDRVGGGICGLVVALVITSIVGLCIQLLPFDRGFLGYARVPQVLPARADDGTVAEPRALDAPDKEIWLGLDRFAVGMVGLLSDGILSGARSLHQEQPDPVQAIGWVGSTRAEVTRYAPPNSISIVKVNGADTAVVPQVYQLTPGNPRAGETTRHEAMSPPGGREFRVVRLKLKDSARSKVNKDHVFTLRQIRLVGRDVYGTAMQLHAVAIQENLEEEGRAPAINRHIRAVSKWGKTWPVTEIPYNPREDHRDEIEVVFEVPLGFQPWYVEYKLGGARALVSFAAGDAAPQAGAGGGGGAPPLSGSTAERGSAPAGATVPSVGLGGNVRAATTRSGASFFGDGLPLTLTDYTERQNAEISRGVLQEGSLVAEVSKQGGGRKAPVSRLQVPGEQRLLHLNVARLQARSTYGRARQFAVETVQNYKVIDDRGNEYRICGKYAQAQVGGVDLFEIQYFPNQAGSLGGLGQFDRIKNSDLKDDYDLVFLFLVNPGVTIVRFTTGGSADRADDLEGENLVAPS